MPTPSERLGKIIAAQSPSESVFRVIKLSGGSLQLERVITKKRESKDLIEDSELQVALAPAIEELWNADAGKHYINATIDSLWSTIKRKIRHEYDEISTRCAATKRKTDQFILDITITDKHLSNYLIQVFIKINAPSSRLLTRVEWRAFFEQFESLRKTYGRKK